MRFPQIFQKKISGGGGKQERAVSIDAGKNFRLDKFAILTSLQHEYESWMDLFFDVSEAEYSKY